MIRMIEASIDGLIHGDPVEWFGLLIIVIFVLAALVDD